MKRTLIVCAAVAVGASTVPAASPAVEQAIKAIQAVGADAGRLKLFCDLNKMLQSAADSDDPAVDKQIEALGAQIGPDFEAAWDVGAGLDENSEDGMEFFAAIDALAEKCQ